MVKRLLLVLLTFFVFNVHDSWAQNITMSNATNSTCGGSFFDSGGQANAYGNNLNLTQTICSSTPGSCVSISFTSFDLGTGDTLRIYNGNSTAAALVGTYTGGQNPGPIISSSGCLTFVFKSNGTVTGPGWIGQLSCINCPTSNCATTCSGGPAPANDACGTAQNLGSLPTPTPCPGGAATSLTINSSNLCATAAVPYSALPGCQPSGANMANPAADVWYRFTVTAPVLNIGLSGGLTTPTIGLYSGTSCTSLNPVGCAVGNAGSLTASYSGLPAGTYYLQVSGGNVNDQCNYTLSLQNNFDCSGCVIQANMTVNPPPVNGYYYPGQTVNFCYTISNYNQTSNNWLHGVVPSFSPGWDMSSFVPVSSTNCSNAGTWNWYNTNVTSSANGQTFGPGFYYESALGSPIGLTDGNPGNNFGDNNPNNVCDWTFCWRINTDPAANCVQGAVLNVSVNSLGDGESGSWGSVACTQDPNANFLAYLNCCLPPTLATVNPLCPGQTNGSATATGQGVGPWDYIWSDVNGVAFLTQNNLSGSGTASNLAAGTYAVTVVDATGCTASQFFTISTPAGGTFTASANPTPVACAGGNTGAVSVSLNGGAAAFSYAWTPAGPNSPTRNNLAAGTYSVVVTDANGCTATATATVAQPPVLNINIPATTNVACAGGQTGSITAAASGGSPNYTYAWSGGASGATASGLTAGTYTVTVTDNAGCTAVTTASISQPTPLVLNTSSTAANCGSSNGSASVAASGGSGGYNYIWTPSGGSASTASGLSAGSYNVTVTDVNGCTSATSVSVASTTGPTASILNQTNVACNGGSTGSVQVGPVGGTAPFNYTWSPAVSNSNSASGLAAGNYTVTITDNSGCTATVAIAITQPPALTASVISNTPQSCVGVSDGALTVQGLGGSSGYSVSWSNGASGATASGLAPGSYTATVTDANGCTTTVTANVAAATPIVPTINSVVPVSCNGGANGSATASASGGTAGYSYAWSNGASGVTASGLSAGNYVVTITDGSGCTVTTQTSIVQPAAIVAQPSTNPSTCGNSNGSASVSVSGGTPVYSYNWAPSGGSGSSATGLAAGTYSVTVTDLNGCTASVAGISVVDQPAPQALINAVSDVTCSGANNGSVTVQANGGTQPLTYTWSTGQSGNSPSISGLAPGTYSVTVSDANGCTALATATVATPTPIQTSLTPVAAHCGQADGSVSASVLGGTPGYTYSWSSGSTGAAISNVIPGTYSVTVTDVNGCTQVVQATVANTPPPVLAQTALTNALCAGTATGSASVSAAGGTGPYTYLWSNGAGGSVASNLATGTYTVTVTDVYGCTAVLTIPVTEPLPLLVVPAPTPSTCGQSNGAVSIAISGGTQPYIPTWNTGASNTTNLSGLVAGSYSATVTDNNGCTQSVQVSVSDLPSPVLANPTATPVSCNGGSNGTTAVVLVSSTGAVNYSWSPSGGNSATASGLTAGTYTVTATDNNGCTATQTVIVSQPPLLVPAAQSLPALCNASPTGSASVLASGGVSSYTYSWSNGASGSAASNLFAGSYTVVVTDNNGCTAQTTVQVAQPAALALPLTPVNANCNGASTGSVSSLASGGTTPYTYLWNTGSTLSAVSAVPAGTYTVTVTDANGCTLQNTVVVTQPTPVVVQASVTDATCSQNNGTASANASGGTGTLNYTWSNTQTGSSVSGLAPGSYTVTATDANGCTATSTVSLINYPAPTLNPPVSTPVSCNGGANGTASVSVLSGTGPYAYAWSPSGGSSNAASGLSAGNYSIVVTDNNGCTSTTSVVITQPTALNLQLSSTQATCGNPNGSVSAVVSGGTQAYYYSWSSGSINSTTGGLLAGNYTLTVTDNNGCTVVGQVAVPTPPALAVIASASPANCNGAATGAASAAVAGGTSPFTYAWTNGSIQQNPSGLPAGAYTVVITDANGCTATTAAAVVTQPTPIVLQTQSTASLCSTANGTAQVSGSGGTGLLNYVWSNGQTGNSISNLAAGSYTATATDANGCTSVAVAAVSNLGGPTLVVSQPTAVSCAGGNNGSASVLVAPGGNGPFLYNWTPSGGINPTATGLSAGNYQVTVTDANGCIAVESYVITEPLPLQATASGQPVNCNGNSTGSVSASAAGGVTGYSYAWSNGATASAVSALPAGIYTVTVTDANGCTDNASFVVNQPPLLTANASVTPVSCNGGNNGTASVSAGGGTSPYAYTWSNGSGNSGQNNLVAGTYNVVVTDANGCTRSASGTITQPTAIALQVNTTPSTCGNSNGAISVVGSGGTGALQYQWSNGSTLITNNNIAAGAYTVTATDANGCTATANAAVNNQGGPQVALQASTNVTC
ncbi:MAG: hypothetical protein LW707_03980, partial [Sphingobacteriales bacterium]|nr:hypothetical protein [Sphingobacteriales bacterium]